MSVAPIRPSVAPGRTLTAPVSSVKVVPLVAVCLSATLGVSPVLAQDPGASPTYGDLELEEAFLPDPRSVDLTSGGSIEVDVDGCSYGYVAESPDVDLYYTTSGGADLHIYAEGDDDLTLLVNTPAGKWLCDDDSHGNLDPVLTFPEAAGGLYNIWVGSYSDDFFDATLYVSELDPESGLSLGGDGGLGGTGGGPDLSLQPTYGDVELDQGFLPDPHTVELTAGGGIESDLPGCDYGYVAEAPDVDLYYTSNGQADLYIWVDSDDDTTLLVNRPDANWLCDDDGLGDLNPVIAIPNASQGLYDIWVGTYGDELVDATLHISEIDPR